MNTESHDSTIQALALSPANVHRRLDNLNINNNSKHLLTSIQQNAQKISKRLTDALNQNKSYVKLNENPNMKLPISVYAGVVVTSSRSSRRRYIY